MDTLANWLRGYIQRGSRILSAGVCIHNDPEAFPKTEGERAQSANKDSSCCSRIFEPITSNSNRQNSNSEIDHEGDRDPCIHFACSNDSDEDERRGICRQSIIVPRPFVPPINSYTNCEFWSTTEMLQRE